MKTLITFLLFVAFAVAAFAQSSVVVVSDLNKLSLPKYYQYLRTATNSAVPEKLSTTNLWCRRAVLVGMKSYRTNNLGTVYIGATSTNDQQVISMAAGAQITLEAPFGTKLNLINWYYDVQTNNDGVILILDSF